MPKSVVIPQNFIDQIRDQAEKAYPRECCGMLLGPAGKGGEISRIRSCQNVQDACHQKDPQNFPRTAQTAYFIDPRELLEIEKECRKNRESIRMIYHSHVNAGAYFSEEDKRIAALEGTPSYPGVDYLVVSVIENKAKDQQVFSWDETRKDFLAVPFKVL